MVIEDVSLAASMEERGGAERWTPVSEQISDGELPGGEVKAGSLFDAPPALAQLVGQDVSVRPHPEAMSGGVGASAPIPLPEAALLGTRRLAWGGDGRRGTARLEIAAGPLAGAEITVEVDGREVEIRLELAGEGSVEPWAERVREQFSQRGLQLKRLERGE